MTELLLFLVAVAAFAALIVGAMRIESARASRGAHALAAKLEAGRVTQVRGPGQWRLHEVHGWSRGCTVWLHPITLRESAPRPGSPPARFGLLADELVVAAPQAGHARPGQGRMRVNGGVLEVEGDLWPATNPELASALMACRATVLFERGVARARLARLTDAAEGTRAAALATALAEYLGSHRADALSPRGDAMDASKRAQ